MQEVARRWGIREGGAVVVYDGGGSRAAARAWWVLRDAGIADVRILDGQLPAWTAAGLPLEADQVVPALGDVTLTSGLLAVLGVPDGGEVAVYCGSGVSAALEVAALALAGIDAVLYPGSWSAWSNRPELPVATGAEPGGDR